MNNYLLLAPGPVNLHPKVRAILSEPMIHHRTPLFDQSLKRVLEKLPSLFGTSQRVYLQSSTGSGGMEALMVNTCNRGDSVLVINSGKFGERWAEMGRAFGLNVDEIKVPWGEAVDPLVVEARLRARSQNLPMGTEPSDPSMGTEPSDPSNRGSGYVAVFCQACETSTGVKHPLKELGAIIKNYPQTLFLVDGITALGAYSVPMDEWHIDGLVAGSQKAFMLPTGLSLYSFSKKAWLRIPTVTMPRFYFDVREEDKANERGETWFSSNVSLVRALDVVLDMIFEKGLDAHFKEIAERAHFTRHFIQKMGFTLLPKVPSESLTAFHLPSGCDSQTLRSRLEKDFSITVMGGQDQLKGKILRVGHMGYITRSDLVRFFVDFQILLEQTKVPFQKITESEMLAWFQS